jgi:hypothetical protein
MTRAITLLFALAVVGGLVGAGGCALELAGQPVALRVLPDPPLEPILEVGQVTGAFSGQAVSVRGHIVGVDGGVARLCSDVEQALPPRCAGDRVELLDVRRAPVDFETAGGRFFSAGEVTISAIVVTTGPPDS